MNIFDVLSTLPDSPRYNSTDYLKVLLCIRAGKSIREISDYCGIPSLSTVHIFIEELEYVGLIERGEYRKHQTRKLTRRGWRLVALYGLEGGKVFEGELVKSCAEAEQITC